MGTLGEIENLVTNADNQKDLILMKEKLRLDDCYSLFMAISTGCVTQVVCSSKGFPSGNIVPSVTCCSKCRFAYGRDRCINRTMKLSDYFCHNSISIDRVFSLQLCSLSRSGHAHR